MLLQLLSEAKVRAVSGFVLATVNLMGLVAAVGWLAWAGLAASGESIAPGEYIALAFGAFSAGSLAPD